MCVNDAEDPRILLETIPRVDPASRHARRLVRGKIHVCFSFRVGTRSKEGTLPLTSSCFLRRKILVHRFLAHDETGVPFHESASVAVRRRFLETGRAQGRNEGPERGAGMPDRRPPASDPLLDVEGARNASDEGRIARPTRASERPWRKSEGAVGTDLLPCACDGVRLRQDSNLRGRSPMDFKSISLTTRTHNPFHASPRTASPRVHLRWDPRSAGHVSPRHTPREGS